MSLSGKSKKNIHVPREGVSSVTDSQNVTTRAKVPVSVSPPSVTCNDIRQIVKEELQCSLDLLKKNIIEQFENKLKDVLDHVAGITSSISFLEEKYETIREDMSNKIKCIKTLETENSILKTNISELTTRLNLIEQHGRADNLEIQCIPEHKNENLLSVTKQIANSINYKLNDADIHLCTRIAKQNKDSRRPRSVLVKFSNQRIRDAFLAATINFNKKASNPTERLNTSHLGIGGDKKPIYVLQHLSPTVKSPHAAARLKAKEIGYRFVWVKGGTVYMRKSEDSAYKNIKNINCLKDLS